ncbi:Uncharacterised protein [Mycolicibacterium vanbaalenii]|uniref:Uncharacterized protein n=1 Tax=Mycolicibacterium vanbaalenii TaxID=110539 RepID=A0A5S9NZ86_MYCVN|nr:Uncharacterised protein [Mycolicibacterium vanbaalenii]
MPVLVTGEQVADEGVRLTHTLGDGLILSNPIGDRSGQVVAERHDAQLPALAVDQELGAGRPAGQVAAMHARYPGAA